MTKQLLIFLLFIILTPLVYYLLPKNTWRRVFLLMISWAFYCICSLSAFPLILAEILLAYFSARAMTKYAEYKKLILVLDLVIIFGALGVFKYLGFAVSSVSSLLKLAGMDGLEVLKILVPIGISFFSFVISGYLIDVYKGKSEPEDNFITFALFASFFPIILSGPIERSTNLLSQLRNLPSYSSERTREGISRIIIGLTKKILLADQLAVIVNSAYASPETFSGIELLFCVCCYTMQIYCDFVAYSDIAIGGAKLLGFDLLENFTQPYLTKSVKDFWRNCHRTLSNWFKDYLYIPLGGSRKGKLRTYINVMIVFTVSGLWHGAAWTFVIWGVITGLYQVIGAVILPYRKKLYSALKLGEDSKFLEIWQIVFCFLLATIAWTFFKSESLSKALLVLGRIFTFAGGFSLSASALGMSVMQLAALAIWMIIFVVLDIKSHKNNISKALAKSRLRHG